MVVLAFMWIIICLLDQGKFFSLRLVQTAFYRVCLFQFLEGKDEQFGIMFV